MKIPKHMNKVRAILIILDSGNNITMYELTNKMFKTLDFASLGKKGILQTFADCRNTATHHT